MGNFDHLGNSATTKPENEVEGGILLNGIILEGVAVFELLASEDQTLLIWWDTFLILDLGLDVFDTISWLNLEGDVLASEGLDEDLHTTTEPQNKVQGGVLLDRVVLEGVAVFELLASEDKTLLIWRNAFLVLDLGLDVFNPVGWFDFERDVLASEGLDEDLHLQKYQ